jgi:hypothetical protein
MRQMAYRPHFFMMVAGKIIRIGLLFFFFQAIFFKVDRHKYLFGKFKRPPSKAAFFIWI